MKISKILKDRLPIPDREILMYQGRAEGKTTSLALSYMSRAIDNPETWVKVHDHYGTRDMDLYLFKGIQDFCHRLGLDWFEFSRGQLTIRYCPYLHLKREPYWS